MSNFNVIYNIIAQDRFSGAAKRIKKSIGGINEKFKKAKDSAGKFKASLGKIIASATVVVGSLLAITRVGGRFQDSLADLSAITGATGKDLKFLRDESFRLGKVSAKSGDQVLTAFKLVASAKPELLENTKALSEVTEQVLLLSSAAGIDLVSAANITAQGLNIFGAGADQAARFVNVLAAGAKFGASEIGDTGEAMLIAGPAARAAGLSFEQLNAAIQATALGGIKGARAGTALNSILGRLQRAGIDFQKIGLQGSFELVKNAMDNLGSSTERAQFAAKIFGEEHSKVGFALLANIDMLDKFENKLTGTNTAQEQANVRLATFNSRVSRLGTVIEEKLVGAFELIEPLLTAVLSGTESLISGIGHVLDIFLLRPLKIIGTVIGEVIGFFATGFDVSGFEGFFGRIKDIAFGGAEIVEKVAAEVAPKIAPRVNPRIRPGIMQDGQTEVKSTVDVNLNAPEGAVRAVRSRAGRGAKVNVGLNMVAAQ